MEVFLMYNISINSSIKNYEVSFCDSLLNVLKTELKTDDVIFVDQKVFNLLSGDVQELIGSGKHIIIEATEDQKSYTALKPMIVQLIERRFRKNNRLFAIGGGITQDITAFIASMMFRGVEWMFFPTTLLAQADSCIGGKSSINIGKYKNQLGNFYPPRKIFIIPKLIKTLPELDFKSGMGEMLHFYLVSGEDDFSFYQQNYEKAFTNEKSLLALVKRNLEIKKRFIEREEFERGERQLLNYGHSFGHAIESLTNYKIPHGIAVSYGMDIANFISVKLGFIENSFRHHVRIQLKQIWEGTSINNISTQDFENALSKDKKNIGASYQLILTKGFGKMLKHGITPNTEFTNWLSEYFKSAH